MSPLAIEFSIDVIGDDLTLAQAFHYLFFERTQLAAILLHLGANEFGAKAVEATPADETGHVLIRYAGDDQSGNIFVNQIRWAETVAREGVLGRHRRSGGRGAAPWPVLQSRSVSGQAQ